MVWILFPGVLWAQRSFNLQGHPEDPFASSSDKVFVLVFLRRDCPVSGRYAPSVQQISKRFSNQANFWLVYPDKSDSPEAIQKSVDDFGYHLPVLRDPDHALAKLAHVQITPEVAVFDRDHKLVYDGRIDDRYIDFTRVRPSPTTHELEDAIRAAASGKTLARNEVRGVGCYISDLP
jgi:AhpC/TSA family